MDYWNDVLECTNFYSNSKRRKPFVIVGYSFNYLEDKDLIDILLKKSQDLAKNVFPGKANDADTKRSKNRVYANCIAGVVSEYCWMHFLNFKRQTVASTIYTSASEQIDLEVLANKKRIEVRSSFPRNGLKFAICDPKYEFDILGPYANAYKPDEIFKDYFVRTLFPLATPTDIIKSIKSNNFEFYLTGGATHEMMYDESISIEKNLIPEDSIIHSSPSKYRVVPFHSALDCREIYKLIMGEK